jgi:hypothetical protein
MATMLEVYTTEEQHSVVRFCGQKNSMQKIFIKNCCLFTVGSVCHVEQFTAGSRHSVKDVRKSLTMPNQVTMLTLQQKQQYSRRKSSFELTEG